MPKKRNISIRKAKKLAKKRGWFPKDGTRPPGTVGDWGYDRLKKKRGRAKASRNPKHLLFATKSQALAYARSHGIPKSRYSLKRMKKAR